MAVAHEELHSSLKRVRGECTRVKKKLEESCDKGERLKVIAVEREKVLPYF
jgi:predicted transcriptional regulator